VSFQNKIQFDTLVHLVGFTIAVLFLLVCASNFWWRSYRTPVTVTEIKHRAFTSITEWNHDSTCQIKWFWNFIGGSELDMFCIQVSNRSSKVLFKQYCSKDNANILVSSYIKAVPPKTLHSIEFSSEMPLIIPCTRTRVCTLILQILIQHANQCI